MSHQIFCEGCGAPMRPLEDGRVHACDYCGAKVQAAIGADQLEAALALDLSNADAFAHELARSLHGSLGPRTKLHAEGTRVHTFEVNLDPDLFVLKREMHGMVAQHRKLVRGIALKTTTHPLDHWVQLLTTSLAVYANENARIAQVVATLRRS